MWLRARANKLSRIVFFLMLLFLICLIEFGGLLTRQVISRFKSLGITLRIFHQGVVVLTRWCKEIPRRINIFSWRISLYKLPTWFNLSKKGLELSSILCPICCCGVEIVQHLFFSMSSSSWCLEAYWKTVRFDASCGTLDKGMTSLGWWLSSPCCKKWHLEVIIFIILVYFVPS